MSGEMVVKKRPFGFRIFWVAVYIFAVIFVVYLVNAAATGIRSHSLPKGSVQLSLPYSKYAVGETVSFSIKNNYNSSIDIVNNCPYEPLAVYFWENSSWVREHSQVAIGECPNEDRQVSVAAGGSVEGNFGPWASLFSKPGKYRIVAFVEYYNALPYQDIEIVNPSAQTLTSSATTDNNSTPTSQITQPAATPTTQVTTSQHDSQLLEQDD